MLITPVLATCRATLPMLRTPKKSGEMMPATITSATKITIVL